MSQETRANFIQDSILLLLNDVIDMRESDIEYLKRKAKVIKQFLEQ